MQEMLAVEGNTVESEKLELISTVQSAQILPLSAGPLSHRRLLHLSVTERVDAPPRLHNPKRLVDRPIQMRLL